MPFSVYNNPLFFETGAINNPDIISQSQMIKAQDWDLFLKVQLEEIVGLEEAKVFDFHKIKSLPSSHKLINTIWSYRFK